jgi:hypothetical protein
MLCFSASPSATGILIAPSFEDLSPLIDYSLLGDNTIARKSAIGKVHARQAMEGMYVCRHLSLD